MPPAPSSVNSALHSLPATQGSGLWALEGQVWSGGNWHPDTCQARRPRRLTPSAGAWLRAAGPAVGPRLQVSRAPHPAAPAPRVLAAGPFLLQKHLHLRPLLRRLQDAVSSTSGPTQGS